MARLNQRINEAERVFWGIQIYEIILDFLIIFLVYSIFLQIIRFSIIFAIFPTMITMVLFLYYKIRNVDMISKIEAKNPMLKERLKTAKDNIQADNIIARDLKDDVSSALNTMEASSFLETKTFTSRVVMVIGLLFVLITFAAFDLRDLSADLLNKNKILDSVGIMIDEYNREFGDASKRRGNDWEATEDLYNISEKEKLGAESGGEKSGYSEGPIAGKGWGSGGEENPNIYGDASAANLYGKDINFKLHPEYGGDIEIHDTSEIRERIRFTLDNVRSAETCDECVIGPEYEEIVRKYFEKIVGET